MRLTIKILSDEFFYQQSTHVSFLCPMRFESFPLDSHVCRFRLGSSSYNEEKMEFSTTLLDYNAESQNTILDYKAGQSLLLYGLN